MAERLFSGLTIEETALIVGASLPKDQIKLESMMAFLRAFEMAGEGITPKMEKKYREWVYAFDTVVDVPKLD